MGLAEFAKNKLNETLDRKLQTEQDASKFYSYISQHADEIVANLNVVRPQMLGCDEVGIESKAKDVVGMLRHDENGAYVDAGNYRIYIQYDGNFSSIFSISGYTCVNGTGTSVDAPLTSNSIFDSVNFNENIFNKEKKEESEEERREREEARKERQKIKRREREETRKEKQEIKIRVNEINNAPMPEPKDIVMEIITCEQNSDNKSLSDDERSAYGSRAKLLTEYAKQKYANDPEVKAYLRKDMLHNNRFRIMWGVFLFIVVIAFIVCDEWWQYFFVVLGIIVVGAVLGLIHMYKS